MYVTIAAISNSHAKWFIILTFAFLNCIHHTYHSSCSAATFQTTKTGFPCQEILKVSSTGKTMC